MVERQGQREDGTQGNRSLVSGRLAEESSDTQDGDLRQVQHRRGKDASHGAIVGDGEGAAAQVGQRNSPCLRQVGEALQFRRQGQQGLAVNVFQHRHDKALRRVGGDAEMVVALDDEVLLVVGE